jgi:hypothetical protein
MTEVTMQNMALSGVIMGLVIIAGVMLFAQAGVDNPSILADGNFTAFNNSLNKFNDATQMSSDNFGSTTEAQIDNPVTSLFDTIFNKFTSVIKTMGTGFTFINDFFKAFGQQFGLPNFIAAAIWALIGIIITFSILALIFNRKP